MRTLKQAGVPFVRRWAFRIRWFPEVALVTVVTGALFRLMPFVVVCVDGDRLDRLFEWLEAACDRILDDRTRLIDQFGVGRSAMRNGERR